MLLDTLRLHLTSAMKARDAVKVSTIRFLLAAVANVAIDKYGAAGETKLTDADVLDVVKKQVKTHNESIEAFHPPSDFCALMRETGFAQVLATPLTWGVASIYRGLKRPG